MKRSIRLTKGNRQVIVQSDNDLLIPMFDVAIRAWEKVSAEEKDEVRQDAKDVIGFAATGLIAERSSGPEYVGSHEGDLHDRSAS